MSTSTAARLPDDVTEQILERLPLSDYVRFPAVCRRWRSIQTDHRRRHAPSPPPMIRLPWLIPWGSDAETVPCYSPFEARTYHIKFPEYIHPFPDSGWLRLSDSMFNPISNIHIPFPEPLDDTPVKTVAISPSPSLVVFVIMDSQELFFFRQGDPRWTKLLLPLPDDEIFIDAVTVGGRLYCFSSSHKEPITEHLVIVDPIPTPPTVLSYPMRASSNSWHPTLLVESDGQLLMLKRISEGMFHLFRPDIPKRVWTRMTSLGDRLLLRHWSGAVSLLAADVGLKKNCIYFRDGFGDDNNWKVFDLGIGMVMDTSFLNDPLLLDKIHYMFLPSMC